MSLGRKEDKINQAKPWKEGLGLSQGDLDSGKIKLQINIQKVSIFFLCCAILMVIKTTLYKLYWLFRYHKHLRQTKCVEFRFFCLSLIWMLPSWLFTLNMVYTSQKPTVFYMQQIVLISLYIAARSSPCLPLQASSLPTPHAFSKRICVITLVSFSAQNRGLPMRLSSLRTDAVCFSSYFQH